MTVDELRKRRQSRGMNDPLNRLRAHTARLLQSGEEAVLEKAN